jgi:hypothetical protein
LPWICPLGGTWIVLEGFDNERDKAEVR